MIIDFHTHIFPDKIAAKTIAHLATISRSQPYTDGSGLQLSASMEKAGIDYSINLPVMTSAGQTAKVNRSLADQQEELLKQGIITFGGIHPLNEDYKEQLHIAKECGFAGIKIHPAYQGVDLDDMRFLKILDYASELDLIMISHCGLDIGLYDRNYASVKMILNVIETVHPSKFVLAHMGGWWCWDDVERDLAGAPVWLDTAFSLGPIDPNPVCSEPPIRTENMRADDFLRLSRKHGTDRVLFATDCPWSDQTTNILRMKNVGFTDTELSALFSENALRLLGKPLPERI